MAMKEYSTFPKAPALLKPHYEIVQCRILNTRLRDLTPVQGCNQCILQPHATGQILFRLYTTQSKKHVIKFPPYLPSSSSCRAGSTDIPDPLSLLFPIVHRLWQVFWTTSRILTQLLNVCSCWSSCFCTAMCGGP